MWNGLWPLQAVVLAILAVGVSGILPALGPWLQSGLLVIAAGLLGWTLWQRRAAWRPPSRAEATRRLEQDSGVEHRPLQSLDDQPLGDDPVALALWQAHRRRVEEQLQRLTPYPPSSRLSHLDRRAWRALALLALVVAVVVAGRDWADHLGESLQPRFAAAVPPSPPIVDVWVEPPAYTRHPPVFAPASGEELRFPAGSTLVARIGAVLDNEPSLSIDGVLQPMPAEAENQFAASVEVSEGAELLITAGPELLGQWPLTVVYDQPPTAAFTRPPAATPRYSVRLDYTLADDYGLAEAWAEIRLTAPGAGAPHDERLRLPLPIGHDAPAKAEASTFHDLTPHRWAGRRVQIRLHASDAAGQMGRSDAEAFVLPERKFTHPVARQIITARKLLDAGAEHRDVGHALALIASYPERFDEDAAVFLMLSSSIHRLRHSDSLATKDAVRSLLWDLALRLDEGGLPSAEADLRAAQKALQEALARDADDAEIRRLVEELREALRRFTEAMARQAPPPQQAPPGTPPPENTITGQELEQMLDQIQRMAEAGSRSAAQQLLSQMQQMLESLQTAQPMSQAQQQQAEAMTRMLNQLQEMQRRQQSLIDQTFRESQSGQPAPNGPPPATDQQMPRLPDLGLNFPQLGPLGQQPRLGQNPPPAQSQQSGQPMPGLAQDQDSLRRDLGELMRQLSEQFGSIPQAMQDAELAMRRARDSLNQGEGGQALDAEGEALEHLRQMSSDMAQQLAQRFGMGGGGGQGSGNPAQPGSRQPRDPLGRQGETGQATETGPSIPDESEFQRARRIRDQLYQRSADPDRPVREQDYLRRLLERF